MGKTKPNDHNEVVLKVGQVLASKKDLGTVHADHLDKGTCAKHGFKPKLILRVEPPEVLSAFVPTQALFSCRVVFPNLDWKEPDLAVTRDGFTYVLEVYDAKDNYTSVARKIETVIANSVAHKIVGMAVIEKGAPYTRKAEQLERVRGTFHRLFGKSSDVLCPENCRTYLRPLFSHSTVRDLYEEIHWDAVLEMSIDDDDWADTLCERVDAALKAKILLAQPAPTS